MVRSIGTSTIIYGDVDITNTGVANAGGNVCIITKSNKQQFILSIK